MKTLFQKYADLYPVWVVIATIMALIQPATFAWFNASCVTWAMSVVMLGMGFTLKGEDFLRIFKMPGSLALGFLAHYSIMPLTGWALAHVLHLSPSFAVGLILVASCPSGTASNVISFLARANVALAVLVTLTSTLFAFITTPLLCLYLAGQYMPIDAMGLCLSMVKIVIVPVSIGIFCNWRFPRQISKIAMYGPPVSVTALVCITGSIVASNAAAVMANAGKLTLAAMFLHLTGFGVGYLVAKLLRFTEDVSRTISIEVGMQNGGMAAVLARKNFPLDPLTAVPAVFSGLVQTFLGGILASFWRKRPINGGADVKCSVRQEVETTRIH